MTRSQFQRSLNIIWLKEGYEVFTAYDGEEALEKVEEVEPDLIIF